VTVRGIEVADYRIIGLLDMAAAIRQGRPHRASGDMALHVLEVMDAFEKSSLEGRHIVIDTPCARPEPLPLGVDETVFLSDDHVLEEKPIPRPSACAAEPPSR
jgi:hypothetical protein